MRRAALLAALLALAPGTALAKLEPAEWSKAEKAAKTLFVEAGEPDAKLELVKTLAGDGEPRAYRLLADALFLEGAHVPKVAKYYEEALAKLQPMLARSFKEMRQADYDALVTQQAEVRSLERSTADEARVLDAIVETLAGGPADVRKAVLSKAKGHVEWTVRASGARLAAATAEDPVSKPFLTEALEKEKDARVRRAALVTLGKAKGTLWHPLLVGRLSDPDWTVQILATRLAAEREIGRAIPALIEALPKADSRVTEEMGAALRKLTGQNFDASTEVWSKWWADNRGKFGDDGRPLEPLGPGAPNPRDVEFYGLKVKADRVLFVVDMSSSMRLEVEPLPPVSPPGAQPTTGSPPPPAPAGPGKSEKIKIDVARRELKRGLESLPKSAMFNVIAFNHTVVPWQANMSPATPENRSKAYEWFAAIEPAGSTYIDGALQMAFKMAGTGAFDKAYAGVAIDTILLLTDGAPTDNGYPSSQNMDPAEILKHVDEWNALRLVKIHCVGIDRVHGIDFLKKLAAANGGTYVDG